MEPTMISLKVLSTAAAMAVVLPMLAPTASFAQNPNGTKLNYAGRGVGAVAPGARFNGGGGGGFRPGGGAPVARFNGGGGGVYRGGYGGGYHRGGGGFIPGAVAGAVIGGAIASQSYGYAPGYYAPGYYDDQYYDDGGVVDGGVVAVAPAPVGGDDVAYCMQTYRSYNPRLGTYLGNDGYRHPCP
jgi:hypothetical protein